MGKALDFVDKMVQKTQRSGVAGSCVLSNTEEVNMEEKIIEVMSALKRMGIKGKKNRRKIAKKFIKHLSPKIVILEQTEDKLVLNITSSVDAGLFNCITTGNKGFKAYTFPGGHQNALVRIGHFDYIVSDQYLGQILKQIEWVELTRFVPVGATIRISITKQSKKGLRTTSLVEGWFAESDEEIMVPSTVVTVEPRPKPTKKEKEDV